MSCKYFFFFKLTLIIFLLLIPIHSITSQNITQNHAYQQNSLTSSIQSTKSQYKLKLKMDCQELPDLLAPPLPIDAKQHQRLLQTSNPHGFTFLDDYTGMQSFSQQVPIPYLKKIMAVAKKYVRTIIKVTPLSSAASKYQNDSFCKAYVTVPSTYATNGFDVSLYDSVVFIVGMSTSISAGSGCVLNVWPTYGIILLNIDYFDLINDSFQFHDKVKIFIHELSHILGFNLRYYNYFYTFYGSGVRIPYGQVVASNPKDDSQFLIITPKVVQYMRSYFNCSQAQQPIFGAKTQDYYKYASSHWEKQVFNNELLTGQYLTSGMLITPLTLHLFEDTGFYYSVDVTKTDTPNFGKNQGCDFALGVKKGDIQACNSNITHRLCDYYYLSGGTCKANWATDNYYFIFPQTICNEQNTSIPPLLTYSAQSKCFETTTNNNSTVQIGCFISYCIEDGSIVFQYDGTNYTCLNTTSQMNFTINGRTVFCPQYVEDFCNVKTCNEWCHQQGVCVNGQCISLNCTQIVLNCQTCLNDPNSQNRCTKCLNGFYLSPNGLVCSKNCSSLIEFCDFCSFYSFTNVSCKSCIGETTLTIDQTSCQAGCHIPNCLYCKINATGFQECYLCPEGNNPTSNRRSCQRCNITFPFCAVCQKDTSCLTCQVNFYRLYNVGHCDKCVNNIPHCLTCYIDPTFGSGQCGQQQEGYFYSYYYSSITHCHPSCKSCNGITQLNCQKCFLGYQLASDFSCQKNSSYLLSPYQSTCMITNKYYQCPKGCLQCEGSSYSSILCKTPMKGYVLNSNSKPLKCGYGCSTCEKDNPENCVTCYFKMYLSNDGTKKCNHCSSNCAACASYNPSLCTFCQLGYTRSTTHKNGTCLPCPTNCLKCRASTLTKCDACNYGYYINSTSSQCLPCQKNCKNCLVTSIKNCTSCFQGYYKKYGICLKCAQGCLTCLDQNSCQTCLYNFNFNSNRKCVLKCQHPCLECADNQPNNCRKCAQGYTLNETTHSCSQLLTCSSGNCTICPFGTRMNNGFCQKCLVQGCENCQNNIQACKDCASGFFIQNLLCYACPAKCKTCISSDYCLQCGEGYTITYAYDSNVNIQVGGKCVNCNSKCRTCASYNPNLCTSCPLNKQLAGSKCFNKLKTQFQLKLDKNYDLFLQELVFEQLKTLFTGFLNLTNSDTDLVYFSSYKRGSTIIAGNIFASQTNLVTQQSSQKLICGQAQSVKSLFSFPQILGIPILNYTLSVPLVPTCSVNFPQNKTTNPPPQPPQPPVIQNNSDYFPAFLSVLIILIIVCFGIIIYVIYNWCFKKKVTNDWKEKQLFEGGSNSDYVYNKNHHNASSTSRIDDYEQNAQNNQDQRVQNSIKMSNGTENSQHKKRPRHHRKRLQINNNQYQEKNQNKVQHVIQQRQSNQDGFQMLN